MLSSTWFLIGWLLLPLAATSASILDIGTGASCCSSQISPLTLHQVLQQIPTGGGRDLDEEYDVEYEEYDEEEDVAEKCREEYDHHLVDPPKRDRRRPDSKKYDHKMTKPPPSQKRNRSNRQKKAPHWTSKLAGNSLKLTSQMAWKTVTVPGKVAYHLIRPKHVDERDIHGLWRLDQQIEKGDKVISSVATIEIDTKRQVVIVHLEGKTLVEPFSFTKTKLGSYQTEFIARAFMVGSEARVYGYRGTWQRKVADPNVLKLVGKIYQLRKNRLSKGFSFGPAVGTFVARRRIQMEDNEADEEYDEYDAYDDEEASHGESDPNE